MIVVVMVLIVWEMFVEFLMKEYALRLEVIYSGYRLLVVTITDIIFQARKRMNKSQ